MVGRVRSHSGSIIAYYEGTVGEATSYEVVVVFAFIEFGQDVLGFFWCDTLDVWFGE